MKRILVLEDNFSKIISLYASSFGKAFELSEVHIAPDVHTALRYLEIVDCVDMAFVDYEVVGGLTGLDFVNLITASKVKEIIVTSQHPGYAKEIHRRCAEKEIPCVRWR